MRWINSPEEIRRLFHEIRGKLPELEQERIKLVVPPFGIPCVVWLDWITKMKILFLWVVFGLSILSGEYILIIFVALFMGLPHGCVAWFHGHSFMVSIPRLYPRKSIPTAIAHELAHVLDLKGMVKHQRKKFLHFFKVGEDLEDVAERIAKERMEGR